MRTLFTRIPPAAILLGGLLIPPIAGAQHFGWPGLAGGLCLSAVELRAWLRQEVAPATPPPDRFPPALPADYHDLPTRSARLRAPAAPAYVGVTERLEGEA